ncbi:fibrillarin-like rRNA/tRNA 2'-O-methyltransferase [Halomarina ordinaria]|uniref:Fibrillarin-like rRNA/tRNA 2'-O-methyltransferase n=1 Tax=Halomarina ordinaria TaxID=3033939 RepID=A0ABD5UAC2_9EURY|nr:fibrillarin-like rRNA/tRNA 2'-O-methyltransferase [Halomarina sp. PSRA2]
MSLPEGVERRTFDLGESGSETRLATRGEPVYGEPTDDGWRLWDARRSKLGATFEKGLDTGLTGGETVLYLGAASGTTVSHVADFAGPTYAVEFAARPARDLLAVTDSRPTLFPLLKDARAPETYAHVVEPVDAIVQDVATRGQARVANANRQFLREGGRLLAAVKARSEDVTADPERVFERFLDDLSGYEVVETARLEPFHDDHLAVVARRV